VNRCAPVPDASALGQFAEALPWFERAVAVVDRVRARPQALQVHAAVHLAFLLGGTAA
jgi:hypothetical protein